MPKLIYKEEVFLSEFDRRHAQAFITVDPKEDPAHHPQSLNHDGTYTDIFELRHWMNANILPIVNKWFLKKPYVALGFTIEDQGSPITLEIAERNTSIQLPSSSESGRKLNTDDTKKIEALIKQFIRENNKKNDDVNVSQMGKFSHNNKNPHAPDTEEKRGNHKKQCLRNS